MILSLSSFLNIKNSNFDILTLKHYSDVSTFLSTCLLCPKAGNLYRQNVGVFQRWAWTRSRAVLEPNFDLFWPDRISAGLGFSAGPDRSQIVMFRVCQLKCAMSYIIHKICYVICINL